MSALAVWMNGERVATWSVRNAVHTLQHEPSWLASPRCRPLSLSLPITAGLRLSGPAVRNWFDNLLPDSADIRERTAWRKFSRDIGWRWPTARLRDCGTPWWRWRRASLAP